MSLLMVRKYGDPILRRKCREIKEIDEPARKFANLMLKVMYQEKGIGLAAPQMGSNERIIVCDVGNSPLILANPKIVKESDKMVSDFESCLSFPGINLRIKRPKEIEIEAYSLKNNQGVRIKAEGLLARVLQHEIDHLDGILIIDRVCFWQKWWAIKKLKRRE